MNYFKYLKLLILTLLLWGCGGKSTTPTSLIQGLRDYTPIQGLQFSGTLTENQFSKIINQLDQQKAITDVKDLLLSEPRFFVSAFNDIFQNQEARKEAIQLFDDLEKSGGLDSTLSFLSALLASSVFEELFIKLGSDSKTLAEYLIDDDIDLITPLSEIISSPLFSDFHAVLSRFIRSGSFPSFAKALSQFLNQTSGNSSGALKIVDLIKFVTTQKLTLLTADEIYFLAENHVGSTFIDTLSAHPEVTELTYPIEGLEGQFSVLSSALWKLSTSHTPMMYNPHQTDLQILLETGRELNRPLIVRENGTVKANLLESLRKFLGSMVFFFNMNTNREDTDESIKERLRVISTYYVTMDLIYRELFDGAYANKDPQEKLEIVFSEYTTKFDFNKNQRIKETFLKIKENISITEKNTVSLKDLILMISTHPLLTYLKKVQENGDNLLLSLLNKADSLFSDKSLLETLGVTLEDLLKFNKPLDDFLKSDKDENGKETWLEYTLDWIKNYQLPGTDRSFIISILKSYQIQNEIVLASYFDFPLPYEFLAEILTGLRTKRVQPLMLELTSRLGQGDIQTKVLDLTKELLSSHLLDQLLSFLSSQKKNSPLLDELVEKLFYLDPTSQTRLVTPLLDTLSKLASDRAQSKKLVGFLEALGRFFDNPLYTQHLITTYESCHNLSGTNFLQYFKTKEKLKILFNIMAEASRKQVIKKSAPFLKKIIDKNELKNIFTTLIRMLRYSTQMTK